MSAGLCSPGLEMQVALQGNANRVPLLVIGYIPGMGGTAEPSEQ